MYHIVGNSRSLSPSSPSLSPCSLSSCSLSPSSSSSPSSPFSSAIRTVTWQSVDDSLLQSIKQVVPFATLKSATAIDIMTTSLSDIRQTVFDYDMLVLLVQCLITQIVYLEKRRKTFLGFELEDILSVGDGKYFFIANSSRIVSYDTRMCVPFVKPTFTTPGIKNIVKLPAYLCPLTARYSLGELVRSLLGDSIDVIKYTKLYWFLKRCHMLQQDDNSGFAIV